MPLLKLADPEETYTYTHDEGDTFVVRETLDKKRMNQLFDALPDDLVLDGKYNANQVAFALKQAPKLAEKAFAVLAVSWSLRAPCTLETYGKLNPEAGSWIDACLVAQTQRILFGENAEAEREEVGKQRTSPRASRRDTPETES